MIKALMVGFNNLEAFMCQSGLNGSHKTGGGLNPVNKWYGDGNVYYYTWHTSRENASQPLNLWLTFACPVRAHFIRTHLGANRRWATADAAVLTMSYALTFTPQKTLVVNFLGQGNWAYSWRWGKTTGDSYSEDKARGDIKKCLTLASGPINGYLLTALNTAFGQWYAYPPNPFPQHAAAYFVEGVINRYFNALQKGGESPDYAFRIPFSFKVRLGGGSPSVIKGEARIVQPTMRLISDLFTIGPKHFTLSLSGQLVFTFDLHLNQKFWSTYCARIQTYIALDFHETGAKRVGYRLGLYYNNCADAPQKVMEGTISAINAKAPITAAQPHPYQGPLSKALYSCLHGKYAAIRSQLERKTVPVTRLDKNYFRSPLLRTKAVKPVKPQGDDNYPKVPKL